MSYATLGPNCPSHTIAFTSNAKYIAPLSNVYYKYWTNMFKYPGMEFMHTGVNIDGPSPEYIKAWSIENRGKNTPQSNYPGFNQRCPQCFKS